MPYQSLGKYKVLTDSQLTFPHKCAGCGAWSGTFIDTGLDVEFYGEVYICSSCFTEMGNQIGYHSPAQYGALEEENAGLKISLDGALHRNQELNNVLGSYSNLFPNPVFSGRPSEFFITGQSEESESDSGDGDSDSDGEEGSDESIDESGSTDLPDSDNDDLSKLLDI